MDLLQSEFRIEMNAIFFCFASRVIYWTFTRCLPGAQLLKGWLALTRG